MKKGIEMKKPPGNKPRYLHDCGYKRDLKFKMAGKKGDCAANFVKSNDVVIFTNDNGKKQEKIHPSLTNKKEDAIIVTIKDDYFIFVADKKTWTLTVEKNE